MWLPNGRGKISSSFPCLYMPPYTWSMCPCPFPLFIIISYIVRNLTFISVLYLHISLIDKVRNYWSVPFNLKTNTKLSLVFCIGCLNHIQFCVSPWICGIFLCVFFVLSDFNTLFYKLANPISSPWFSCIVGIPKGNSVTREKP